MRELSRLATAIVTELAAKITGSSAGRANTSAMICWIEFR